MSFIGSWRVILEVFIKTKQAKETKKNLKKIKTTKLTKGKNLTEKIQKSLATSFSPFKKEAAIQANKPFSHCTCFPSLCLTVKHDQPVACASFI